jgi:hypothetical protein
MQKFDHNIVHMDRKIHTGRYEASEKRSPLLNYIFKNCIVPFAFKKNAFSRQEIAEIITLKPSNAAVNFLGAN